MSELKGKRILVAGATGRIGEAVARLLRESGARLFLHAGHRRAKLQGLTVELAAEGAGLADVVDKEAIQRVVDRAVAQLGGLDGLVYCAGRPLVSPFLTLNQTDWEQSLRINLEGPFWFSQAVARHLVTEPGGGRIVLVSNLHGVLTVPGLVSVGVTAAALGCLARVGAHELADKGVTVNVVAPAWVEGGAFERELSNRDLRMRVLAGFPAGRMARPAEVAQACAFLVGPAARFITGAILPVDGAYSVTAAEGPVALAAYGTAESRKEP